MNIVSIISPSIDVSTRRRGEAEECGGAGGGNISIAEGVNRKADRNVPRREGRTHAEVGGISSGETHDSRVSAPARSGPGQAVAPGGARGTDGRESPQGASGPAFGSRRFQAAAGGARLLTILVHPTSR